jgi:hypothetical protein
VVRQFPRPVDYRDIVDRTGMSEKVAQNCICRLLKVQCIRFVSGSTRTGKYYEPIPGAQLPPDGRGKHPNSKAALDRGKVMRPSMPISHITAAKPSAPPQGPVRARRKAASRPMGRAPLLGAK